MNLPTIEAPLTATHWGFTNGKFYRFNGIRWEIYITDEENSNYWRSSFFSNAAHERAILLKSLVTLAELERMKAAAAADESYEAPWKDKINESKEQ